MPSALVVTVVHHPDDARIRHRQIEALREAGWRVTYAAPFAAYGLTRPVGTPWLTPVDLPRATGRSRIAALRAARALLRSSAVEHDVVLLHDPELLLATVGTAIGTPVVWDVHEDTAAALEVRPWVPDPLRRPAAAAVRGLERWAERRMPLLLADHQYAGRFRKTHPVVPNTTRVPSSPPPAATPGEDGVQRVVYLGSITMERGAREVVQVGAALRDRTDGAVAVHVIGPAHGDAEQVLREAVRDKAITWHGFVPSDQALPMLDGALAGLSLLHDEANFRPSMPTKVIEYLAHGIPAVSTPLPVPADLIRRSGAGVLVPFGDAAAATAAVLELLADPGAARTMGEAGHAIAAAEFDWGVVAPEFVAALEAAAGLG
ncbi:glycosyltransferase [Ornithinicoccus hortensis]|uniref:Glycosyltransferase involved in cell wall biosynthesis n=1 Tax=Ornithinicoccus hortensis TaxID=82346 RepID=A0A542YMR0_9MICO|nr:glycosyltransferase [Ornithinicoccus hortensis]TQL49388.1 glycosyltransferase involved in cell wall biosynthesis [Ornithinicoccus hortensis]